MYISYYPQLNCKSLDVRNLGLSFSFPLQPNTALKYLSLNFYLFLIAWTVFEKIHPREIEYDAQIKK